MYGKNLVTWYNPWLLIGYGPYQRYLLLKTKTFILFCFALFCFVFFVVALKRAGLIGSTKSRFKIFLNLSYEEELPVSDFTMLSIEVIEFARFQHNYSWTDNNITRRENCEGFCCYCNLSAFEQQSRFRAMCNFFGHEGHPCLCLFLPC